MVGEAFIEQFSNISSKRRHGVLRVLSSGAAYEVWFHDGKIVEVRQSAGRDALEICARLVRSGEIHEKVYELVEKKKVSIAQLFDLLVSRNFAAPQQFHQAKKAHDLDIIHAIGLSEDAVLDFQSQDVRPDPRFPILLSPGQLLLDLCELQQDEERFQSSFGGENFEVTKVSRRAGEVKGLCDFETVVWEMIESSKQIGELFRTLLSEYEIKEALLGFLDRNLVQVELPRSAGVSEPSLLSSEDDLSLGEVEEEKDLWSRIADEAVGAMLQDFDDLLGLREDTDEKPAVAMKPEVSAKAEAVSVEELPRPSVLEEPTSDVVETDMVDEDAASPELESLCHELRNIHDPNAPRQTRAERKETAKKEHAPIRIDANASLFGLVLTFIKICSRHGAQRALFEMNHLFLEQARLEKIILVTLLAYLFSLLGICLLGGFVENFLVSLADFSSDAFLSMVE